MRTVRSGDPIKAIRKAVDNSLMGRLLGLSGGGPVSDWDAIPQYNPNQSVYDVDPAGLPSSIDTFIRDFTPVGDIQTLIESVKAAKDGNYAIAALGPLLMVLPQALGNKLKGAVKQIDDARGLGGAVREGEVVKALAELDNIGDEVMKFRQSNPQALDQAMMESVQGMSTRGTDMQSLPFRAIDSKDLAVDALAANRQRALGYTGLDPLAMEVIPSASSLPMGGIPITSVDPRGMQMVTGTPSERAVQNAMMHQRHGSTNKTGLLGSDEMQRFAVEKDLNRIPIPGTKFSVLRDGDVIPLKASEIREGDIITSLSQQAPQGQMGMDRIVSTSGRDLGDLDEMFGSSLMQGYSLSEINFFDSDKFKSLPKKKQNKLTDLYKSTDDPKVAVQFDDMASGLGLGKESSDLFPHNKTNYKNPMSMNLFEGGLELGELTVPDRNLGMYLKKAAPPLVKDLDVNNPAFKITNTKGMPITRADAYRPGGRNYRDGAYAGEDEFGISAKQAFKVLDTGLEEQGVPFMLLSPETRKKFKYSEGGKIKVNKKRPDGFQVKKYLHGGVHGDPPYTAAPDATSVSMPDLQLLSVLQSLSDTRPTGPTIGPATPIDEDRYNREVRRRDAIARGVNPNLAFMMPPGLQGDPQAAAEYQQDNMLTSPIGQIATAMAFTPIDRAIEAALPFIPSTYAGRQINRLGDYVGTKASQKGEDVLNYVQRTEPEVLSGTLNLQTLNQTGRDMVDQHIARQQEFLTDPVLQKRQRERIAEQTQGFYDNFMANMQKNIPGGTSFQDLQVALRSTGPDASGLDQGAMIADDLLKIQGAMLNGKVNPNSLLVTEGLTKTNQRIQQTRLSYENLGGRRQPLNADQIAARKTMIDDKKREIKSLEQRFRKERAQKFGDPDQTRMERDALEQDVKQLQLDVESSTTGFLDPGAHYQYSTNEIYLGGQTFIDPQTGRIVREHEFEHALQKFPEILNSPLTTPYQMEEFDKVAVALSEMAPRKVSIRTTGVDDIEKFDASLKYFEKTRGGEIIPGSGLGGFSGSVKRYPDRVIERTPMLAELKQDMIDKGVIAARSTDVNESDIIRFLDEYYSPEKNRKFADQAIMGDPTSLRILELFDPSSKNASGVSNAKIMAEQMNKLSAVLLGTGGAAATQDYKYGGKIKVKKKKKSGYKTV